MKYLKHYFLLFSIIFIFNLNSTVFTIKNDSDNSIIVLDPVKNHAVIIEPNKSGMIDTTISGIRNWFISERLNLFTWDNKLNTLVKKYRLVQRYPDHAGNSLTFSQIKSFVTKPTDRFNAVEFVTEKI